MSAAKKIILLLWLVILASLGNASALTPGTTETCVWQKSLATVQTRQAEPLETAGRHQENGNAAYDVAPDSLLAADTALPQFIYRTGSQTGNALTDAAGVSFRDSISSDATGAQVFQPGAKIYTVDTSQLPPGSVIFDGNPAGHVSVFASPAEIQSAIVPQGAANPLSDFGLKALEDGSSYRIPKN